MPLFINMIVVTNCRCTFSAITKIVRIPRLGCYFLVILLSDVMTIHFFFLVCMLNPIYILKLPLHAFKTVCYITLIPFSWFLFLSINHFLYCFAKFNEQCLLVQCKETCFELRV
jgi:hypothetical protein